MPVHLEIVLGGVSFQPSLQEIVGVEACHRLVIALGDVLFSTNAVMSWPGRWSRYSMFFADWVRGSWKSCSASSRIGAATAFACGASSLGCDPRRTVSVFDQKEWSRSRRNPRCLGSNSHWCCNRSGTPSMPRTSQMMNGHVAAIRLRSRESPTELRLDSVIGAVVCSFWWCSLLNSMFLPEIFFGRAVVTIFVPLGIAPAKNEPRRKS